MQVVVADDALGEDLCVLRVGVDKDHAANIAVRINPAREVEPVFQRFPSGIIASKEGAVVFESWVEQTSVRVSHFVSPPSVWNGRQGARTQLRPDIWRNLAVIERSGQVV